MQITLENSMPSFENSVDPARKNAHYESLLVLSLLGATTNHSNQFGLRSGPTECRSRSRSKQFDTLIVFLKELFEKKNDFEKKSADATTKG